MKVSSLRQAATADVGLADARTDLACARRLCGLLRTPRRTSVPVVAVLDEGDLITVTVECGLDEILLPGTGAAEIDARLRLLIARRGAVANQDSVGRVSLGRLVIDEATYTARLRGRPIELTYNEFELLKYLVGHAGQVFTRRQLLQSCGGMTLLAAPAPSMCMCGGCGPSWAPSTSPSSAPSVTWAIRRCDRCAAGLLPRPRLIRTPAPETLHTFGARRFESRPVE